MDGKHLFLLIVGSVTNALIEDTGDQVSKWEDCILRKSAIPKIWTNDPCHRCKLDPSLGKMIHRPDWNQKYVNCSEFCEYITICTVVKYYHPSESILVPPILRPVCYECENRKDEAVRDDDLCSPGCTDCAYYHDVLTASECSKQCNGRPTFCYPIQKSFNHRKCYQASFWFGCTYNKLSGDNAITSSCQECAVQAKTLADAQDCTVACEGLPTYNKGTLTNPSLVQCVQRPASSPTDFFYYEIPPEIARHMHVSNPGNIYPAPEFPNIDRNSSIGMKIFRQFNMTYMTWPRPLGFENI